MIFIKARATRPISVASFRKQAATCFHTIIYITICLVTAEMADEF